MAVSKSSRKKKKKKKNHFYLKKIYALPLEPWEEGAARGAAARSTRRRITVRAKVGLEIECPNGA
jgi:hypothetical protein